MSTDWHPAVEKNCFRNLTSFMAVENNLHGRAMIQRRQPHLSKLNRTEESSQTARWNLCDVIMGS